MRVLRQRRYGLPALMIGLLAGLICSTAASQAQANCTLKTSDIISKRISVSAQQSLMRSMSRGGLAARRASAMILAVKQGKLAYIVERNIGVVAKRGARMRPKKGWWTLIPKGKTSTCLKKPAGEKPMLIYRQKMSSGQVDAALASAWSGCGLPTPRKACNYVVDRHKPPPKTDDKEDRKWLCAPQVACTAGNARTKCGPLGRKNGAEFSTYSCFQGECCGGKMTTNKPRPPSIKVKRTACYRIAERRYYAAKKVCDDIGYKKFKKCAKDTGKSIKPDTPIEILTNAIKGTHCFASSSGGYRACTRRAFNQLEAAKKTCGNIKKSGSTRKRRGG